MLPMLSFLWTSLHSQTVQIFDLAIVKYANPLLFTSMWEHVETDSSEHGEGACFHIYLKLVLVYLEIIGFLVYFITIVRIEFNL